MGFTTIPAAYLLVGLGLGYRFVYIRSCVYIYITMMTSYKYIVFIYKLHYMNMHI